MKASLSALVLALAVSAGLAEEALTLEVTPDAGTEFAVDCRKDGESVLRHAGTEHRAFGFDEGPLECRIRIVGQGGIEVTATAPAGTAMRPAAGGTRS